MAVTVQTLMLRLVQKIDPYSQAGVEFTAGTVGTVRGDVFTSQRQLDIYNEARVALFAALKIVHPDKGELSKRVGATITHNQSFQFTLAGSVSTGAKPTGYLNFVSLANVGNTQIYLADASLIPIVLAGTDPYYKQSSTNMFVFDIGVNFIHYGTYVTSASTYQLAYFGLATFVLSDVTGGVTNETFNDQYHPILLELATAIAAEQGSVDVATLAASMLKLQTIQQ